MQDPDTSKQTLWECRLFPLYDRSEADKTREWILQCYYIGSTHGISTEFLEQLRNVPRLSLMQLLATAYPQAELCWRESLGMLLNKLVFFPACREY